MNLQEIIEEAQALRGLTRCGNWYESAESLIEAIAALCHPSSEGEAVELLSNLFMLRGKKGIPDWMWSWWQRARSFLCIYTQKDVEATRPTAPTQAPAKEGE